MVWNNQLKDFIGAAKKIFNTDDGKKVLAYLKRDIVDSSCLDSTPELTYYKLGQKELIQDLIAYVKHEEELDNVNIVDIDFGGRE